MILGQPSGECACIFGRRVSSAALTLVLWMGLLSPSANAASPTSASEVKLVAAFIFNITKFTEWKPVRPNSGDKFYFTVVENEPLIEALRQVTASKKMAGREIEVRSIDVSKISQKSDEVVVAIPERRAFAALELKKLKGCRCLTVTYQEGMSQEGSIVNFFSDGNHLRFEISLLRAREEGLELSSQLLKLGKVHE